MRIIAGFLIVAMLCLPIAGLAEDTIRQNRALLVGVNEFLSQESTDFSSDNNVQDMAAALQGGTMVFDTVLIPQEPVISTAMLGEWIQKAFGDADANDVSYLYLSTHGDHDARGETVLLLSDGQTECGLTAAALEALFDGIAGTKIILLDACYSGAFIGKGMREQPDTVCFRSADFKVLTSSGAMEESWYWNGQSSLAQGSFYFTQILAQGLSPRWDYPADRNRDGAVTLTELHRYLLQNHGASTPQLYPQEDETVFFTYDTDAEITQEQSPILDVEFSDDVMNADDILTLTYTAVRPVRVAYQIVYFRDGRWQFDEAELLYDDAERFTAFGDLAGAVMPGRKVREISLNQGEDDLYGYVLVQVLSLEDDVLTMQTGHVITVIPTEGNLLLSVQTPADYQAAETMEMPIFVQHSLPCALSVTVVDADGQTVKRLSYRGSTRPLGIVPAGSCYYWNGCDQSGERVSEGEYSVRVEAWIGDSVFSAMSNRIVITR
ncbi:MAG TPA: caspase family protein [Candidatus Limiplasma sp.]|nr:caspase family protein [Candidatus Limiplasma sp.]